MKLLLDTNVLLWWLTGDKRLSNRAREAISLRENEVKASVISVYELIYKAHAGKFPIDIALELEGHAAAAEIPWIPLDLQDMRIGATLEWRHKDPWDRLIVAQAIARSHVLVSADRAVAHAPVESLW